MNRFYSVRRINISIRKRIVHRWQDSCVGVANWQDALRSQLPTSEIYRTSKRSLSLSFPLSLSVDKGCSYSRITSSEKALELFERYERLMTKIDSSRDYVFEEWSKTLPNKILENLKKFLIARERIGPRSPRLIMNFSVELFGILQEVNYLKQMQVKDIPSEALDFYDQCEQFRSYTLSLEKTIDWYNTIQERCTAVELTLIAKEIDEINKLVDIGVQELTWLSEGKRESISLPIHPFKGLKNSFRRHYGVLGEVAGTGGSFASAYQSHPRQPGADSPDHGHLEQTAVV